MTLYYEDEGIRLFYGDNRENMEWTSAQVMITDPPYGINYLSGSRHTPHDSIVGDNDAQLRDDVIQIWGDKPALVFGNWRVIRPEMTRQVLIWGKGNSPGMGDLSLPWGPSYEEIYVLGSGWVGKRRNAVYIINTLKVTHEAREHPTPKPVSLIEQLMEHCPTGIICDPFAGSGSTLIAARLKGREAIGVEIDESYCEIIANRLQQGVLDFDG